MKNTNEYDMKEHRIEQKSFTFSFKYSWQSTIFYELFRYFDKRLLCSSSTKLKNRKGQETFMNCVLKLGIQFDLL